MLNWIVYMYKNEFGIKNLLYLICNKTKPNQTKPIKKPFLVKIIYSQLYGIK